MDFLFQGSRVVSRSIDIYALGACIPEMLALADIRLARFDRASALERNKRLVIVFRFCLICSGIMFGGTVSLRNLCLFYGLYQKKGTLKLEKCFLFYQKYAFSL